MYFFMVSVGISRLYKLSVILRALSSGFFVNGVGIAIPIACTVPVSVPVPVPVPVVIVDSISFSSFSSFPSYHFPSFQRFHRFNQRGHESTNPEVKDRTRTTKQKNTTHSSRQ